MCGIATLFEYHQRNAVNEQALLSMRERMVARGPDGAGIWVDQASGIGLAHRRLAIIDLSDEASQPMQDVSGRYSIVFNGEIYNYRTLREALERCGRKFRTHSDTEVLINTVAEYGVDGLRKLRGMFAFALWDKGQRRLLLARDPYGIKPLYYSDNGSRILVASQVKALLASRLIKTDPEPAGHVGFYLWGTVPEPFTLFKAIRALPAGHYMEVDSETGSAKPQPYLTVDGILAEKSDKETGTESVPPLRKALLDTVRHHLEADVPVGLFLSAGIDSTALAGLLAETGAELRTVTLAFEEYRGTHADESPLAEAVATHYGATHQTISITRRDFEDSLDHIMDSMDQPTIDGVNTYFVSRAAAQIGLKVAMSGVGGDELFGGYPSFHQLPRLVRQISRVPANRQIGRLLRVLLQRMPRGRISPKVPGLLEYGGSFAGAYLLRRGLFMPWELTDNLDPEFLAQGLERLDFLGQIEQVAARVMYPHARVAALETSFYMRNQLLRDSDWASMAHSLEVRTPLVDATLLQGLAPSITGLAPYRKRDLAGVPNNPIPAEIRRRSKTGFTIPVQDWLGDSPSFGLKSFGYRVWAERLHAEYMSQSSIELSN